MKNMSLTSRKLLCIRIAVRLAIILLLSALLVKIRDKYATSQQTIATKESFSEICDRINEIDQFDMLLHHVGQQEGEEAKQLLCILFSDKIHSLKQTLESSDEYTRDFGNIALERLARHKRQHPDYYAYSPSKPNSQ